jgi:iron-sulfur cluster repair protein YtfE (RIC family)
MDFSRQTNRKLYEEHAATIDLMARIERMFGGRAGAFPPPAGDSNWPAFARTVLGALEVEVARHFEFEERDLFPRLEEAGAADLVALLLEEHEAIRGVARPLAERLRASLAGTSQPADWQAMKTLGLELADRLASHAQMEDGALLPALEDVLDEETDRELLFAYAAQ